MSNLVKCVKLVCVNNENCELKLSFPPWFVHVDCSQENKLCPRWKLKCHTNKKRENYQNQILLMSLQLVFYRYVQQVHLTAVMTC